MKNLIKIIDMNVNFGKICQSMESIARCKRKLAKKDEIFRADSKKVIESRLIQSKEILESIKD